MSAQTSFRIISGGNIDRTRVLSFQFDGQTYFGHPGDTLASALLANGIRMVGRSFKYHRPRGILTAGHEEPNAVVQLCGSEDEPNVRATKVVLYEGLQARSTNNWPSLSFDLGALNSWLAPIFPAGFYYKTFMGGLGWNIYGRIIRRMAGLGTTPTQPPTHEYEKRYAHCDVLIVGAGPAGLAAAQVAARGGKRVLLVEDAAEAGGQLRDLPMQIDATPSAQWVAKVVAELDAAPNVQRLMNTIASGYYDHNFLTLLEHTPAAHGLRERFWKLRAREVILACGAIERPLVFSNNDRPGVMMLHAALSFAVQHGVIAGRTMVVVTNNSSAYRAAAELCALGANITAIVDVRTDAPDLAEWPSLHNTEHLSAHVINDVLGKTSVTGVQIAARASAVIGKTIQCDTVLMSGGWTPLVHLSSQTGAKPRFDADIAAFVPGDAVQNERSAGAARGQFRCSDCIADGQQAAIAALRNLDCEAPEIVPPQVEPETDFSIEAIWNLQATQSRPHQAKAFVDFQNDVTARDIHTAVSENMVSVEHVKRYTTAGMATDQGKLGGTNMIGVLSDELGRSLDAVGTTTFRPPYAPLPFGAITANDVGELVMPARRTSITDWVEARGAAMFEAGASYRRPLYFPEDSEDMASAVAREVRACRNNIGIYDGSPLGKFELQGRDVVEFLERVYTNRWANLAVGQGRFGLMLREDGRLMDDGVTFRLDENRYWLFSGTGSADHTQMHLERLLTLEWPELDVHLIRVTSQWTNICVCGPFARELLLAVGTDVALATSELPFMGIRAGHVAGISARVARVGYTGELSFEVNVPAAHGLTLWNALMAAGRVHGITPIGSEASMVMRCEKGFISPGYEGDGIVNPYDAGLGWAVDESKQDFIGKRSLLRDRNNAGMRPSVVGLLPYAEDFVPPDGTPILDGREADGMPNIVGYVTQGVYSPTLKRSIALAVLDDGRNQLGDSVTLASQKRSGPAKVVAPCFYDPKGVRMR